MALLPFQILHAQGIERALRQYGVALDASEPGCGKTYVACAVAARFREPVVIIYTKATIPSWKSVAEGFGIQPILVTNYESIRRGKLSECRGAAPNYRWTLPGNTLSAVFALSDSSFALPIRSYRPLSVRPHGAVERVVNRQTHFLCGCPRLNQAKFDLTIEKTLRKGGEVDSYSTSVSYKIDFFEVTKLLTSCIR